MGLTDHFKAKPEKQLFDNFQALHAKHESLNQRLNELETKTAAATQWLSEQEAAIIRGYHEIGTALRSKDISQFLKLLQEPSAPAIIHLPLPDDAGQGIASFRQWAEAVFSGQDKASAIAALAALPLQPLPVSVLAPPPAIAQAVQTNDAENKTENDVTKKYGLWSRISGTAEKELMEKIAQKEREILSLQTRVPYYIDSLFDWAEAAILPTPESPLYGVPDFKAWAEIQSRYKDPLYTMNQAENDFMAATDKRVLQFGNIARDYDIFATALEGNNGQEAVAALETFKNEPHFSKMTRWILEKHGNASLADFALNRFSFTSDQARVFNKGVDVEGTIAFSAAGYDSEATVLSTVYTRILKSLPLSALKKTMEWVSTASQGREAEAVFLNGDKSKKLHNDYLRDAVKVYGDDPEKLSAVLSTLLGGNEKGGELTTGYARLHKALTDKNGPALANLLDELAPKNLGKVLDLAKFIMPDFEITARIWADFSDNALKARMTETLLDAGAPFLPRRNANAVLEEVLSDATNKENIFPVKTIEKIVNYFSSGEEGEIALMLASPSWLPDLVVRKTETNPELQEQLLAILLKPLKTNLARSHMLFDTADIDQSQNAKERLLELAEAVMGGYIHYQAIAKTGQIEREGLLNPDNVSSVWRQNNLKYLANGKREDIPGTDDAHIDNAMHIIDILSRRKGFVRTETEIINPKNITAFYTDDEGLYCVINNSILEITQKTSDIDAIVEAALLAHPSFIKIDNLLLNIGQLKQIVCEKDGLSLINDAEKIPLRASGATANAVFEMLEKHDNYLISDNRAINLDHVTRLWPGANDKEVAFAINDQISDSTLDPEDQDVTKHGLMFEKSSNVNIIQDIARLKNCAQVGGSALNLDQIFCLHYSNESLTWFANSASEETPASPEEVKSLLKKASALGNQFWIDEEKGIAVNMKLVEVASLRKGNNEIEVSNGGRAISIIDADQESFLKLAHKSGALVLEKSKTADNAIDAELIWPSRITEISVDNPQQLLLNLGGKADTVNLKETDSTGALALIEQAMREKNKPAALAGFVKKMTACWAAPDVYIEKKISGLGDITKHTPETFMKELRDADGIKISDKAKKISRPARQNEEAKDISNIFNSEARKSSAPERKGPSRGYFQ